MPSKKKDEDIKQYVVLVSNFQHNHPDRPSDQKEKIQVWSGSIISLADAKIECLKALRSCKNVYLSKVESTVQLKESPIKYVKYEFKK